MRRASLLAVVCLAFCIPVRADRPAYTPGQLNLARHNTESRLSPDGKTVAFVSDITGFLELWTVDATGGWPRQLSNLGEQVTDIRWSHDSKWIIFSSDYGGNERGDLFRVPAAGGRVDKLTDTKLTEIQPRFSPDDKQLAFVSDPDPDRPFLFQLMVMDLATRKSRALTHEPVNTQFPVWSPDGKTVAVTRSGDDQKGELLLVDAGSGTKFVVEPTMKGGYMLAKQFSPDGKQLLVLARNKAGFMQVAMLDLETASGKLPKPRGPAVFFGPANWDVTAVKWSADGFHFLLNEGGATSLQFLKSPKDRPQVILPADGVLRDLTIDKTGKNLAILREDVRRPADVWVGETRPGARHGLPLKQITFSLMAGVKSENLAKGEMIRYESFDKLPIHALVIKPRVNRLGTPAPAVVYVHGGPNGQRTMAFDPFLQTLSEAGFVVIAPNYRGSTGYGKAFEDANNKDWGGGDLKDLVAAVRFFAAKGEIDPKRVGITGGSYGGYMTLMALCKTPDVWAAGVERYGMPDLVMDYLLSKSRFPEWYETEMGTPKTHAKLFRERSPLPYLDDIKSPLMIFQGANDTNVPRSESDLLVAVLKELKKPHEYIIYDDEGHGFTKRKNLVDVSRRTVAFFTKELKAKGAAKKAARR